MQPRATGSKSRPTARRRLNADDSPFIGPSPAAKRSAEKLEGAVEPRAKRKRIENHMSHVPGTAAGRIHRTGVDGDPLPLTVDFHSFPADVLHRYLAQADATPHLFPSPSSTENPPLPSSVLNAQIMAPRDPSPMAVATPANRPRRDPKEAHRRRSSRLLEEEARTRRAPILADAQAVHAVLATLAVRHFEKQSVREGDALQQFLLKVRR